MPDTRILLIMVLLISITGCYTKTKLVNVPVPVKCPSPQIPQIKDTRLSVSANAPEFVKWCITSVKSCRTDREVLLKLLEQYK
jgi:hypothetical protein